MSLSFNMVVTCDNDAFEIDLEGELARILKVVAHRVEEEEKFGRLYDVNGNDVGVFHIHLEG